MIDEEAASDLRSRMNLDAGQPAGNLRKPARQQEESVIPEPVVHAVEPDGLQARVAEKDFQTGLGRGIVIHDVGHVFAD